MPIEPEITVGELIEKLQKLPQDMVVVGEKGADMDSHCTQYGPLVMKEMLLPKDYVEGWYIKYREPNNCKKFNVLVFE